MGKDLYLQVSTHRQPACSNYSINPKETPSEMRLSLSTAVAVVLLLAALYWEPSSSKVIPIPPQEELIPKNCPQSAIDVDIYHNSLGVWNNTCYYYGVDRKINSEEAQKFCKQSGGFLAMPKSTPNAAVLLTWVEDNTPLVEGGLWIGMSDRRVEGHYKWDDGTDVTNLGWFKQYWLGKFFAGDRDCIAFNLEDRKYHDYSCNEAKLAFICEYPQIYIDPDQTYMIEF